MRSPSASAIVFACAVIATSVSAAGGIADLLVECDACVAVTSEVCRAVFKDKQRLPPGVVASEMLGGVCEIDNLRYYTNPPPVLLPACKKFLAARQEDVEAAFEEVSRDALGGSCRGAVKNVCGAACGKKLKAVPVEQGGLKTLEYRDPDAKAGDSSIPKSFMPKADPSKTKKKAKTPSSSADAKKGGKKGGAEDRSKKQPKKAKKGASEEL
jgi:hypothetical protein